MEEKKRIFIIYLKRFHWVYIQRDYLDLQNKNGRKNEKAKERKHWLWKRVENGLVVVTGGRRAQAGRRRRKRRRRRRKRVEAQHGESVGRRRGAKKAAMACAGTHIQTHI